MANRAERPTGVVVREITRDEARRMFEDDVRRTLGIGADEFIARYDAGEYDDPDDDPKIMKLAFTLEFFRQNDAAEP